MNLYQMAKEQKKENKKLLQIWYAEFQRRHMRKPTEQDALKEVKGLMEGRQRMVRDYTLMKAKLFKSEEPPVETIRDFSPRLKPSEIISGNQS